MIISDWSASNIPPWLMIRCRNLIQRWSSQPLLDERLFVIARPDQPGLPQASAIRLDEIGDLPLILPSGAHGLRAVLNAASARSQRPLNVVAEIDGLAVLMDAVRCCSLGQITQALFEVGGQYRRNM